MTAKTLGNTQQSSLPAMRLTQPIKAASAALLIASLMACSSDDDSDDMTAVTSPDGIVQVPIAAGATETIAAIEASLNRNPDVIVVGTVDHQANAQSVGLEQGPNSVLFFGNPALGSPLMQQNQQAGIDLPQRMHAYEDAEGEAQLSYNSTSFLQQRHGLDADTESLSTISTALMGLAQIVSGATIDADTEGSSTVTEDEGLVVVTSTRSFDETYASLISAIGDAGTLGIFQEIDHQANATGVGLELRPTRVVLFGNPNVGTPLMVSQAASGIDLPLKALVYEDADGNVLVVYNDPAYLAARHGITDQDTLIGNITTAVSSLVATATGTNTGTTGS